MYFFKSNYPISICMYLWWLSTSNDKFGYLGCSLKGPSAKKWDLDLKFLWISTQEPSFVMNRQQINVTGWFRNICDLETIHMKVSLKFSHIVIKRIEYCTEVYTVCFTHADCFELQNVGQKFFKNLKLRRFWYKI